MANYVLVHGAWHGGWCYRDTAAALRKAGHRVLSPTHTGVGQRAHLSVENITLETHIRDIVGCIEAEELDDVTLVGHSYGGMVITGVADRLGSRISSLVYLDAFVPEHEDSLIGLLRKALQPEVAAQFIGAARRRARQAQRHDATAAGRHLQRRPGQARNGSIAAARRKRSPPSRCRCCWQAVARR